MTNMKHRRFFNRFVLILAISSLFPSPLISQGQRTASSLNVKDTAWRAYAGLAENLGTLMLNAFQIKPGWAVYVLLLLLGLAAVVGFSSGLSRLRIAPAHS
jgi:hypothetical protein